jgi:hypothetical protein
MRIRARMETLWWMAAPGGVAGPFDTADLKRRLRAGEIAPATLVCRAGDTRWVAIQETPELSLELAREHRGPARHDPAQTPPPAPGEPWFYNVAPGRAALLDVVSFRLYSLVWAYRHRRWLERRAGPITSPFWQLRFDKWLPPEIASAAHRLGVRDRVRIDLAPLNNALLVLSALCVCLLPIVLVIGFQKLVQAQKAAEIVNQAVAPNAPRPSMDLGEWVSVLLGLGMWIGMPLLFALNVWLAASS